MKAERPEGAQTWAHTLEDLWLLAACAVLTDVSGTSFEVGAKSETQSARPLGVWAQVRTDGDFQGLVAFGIPAATREFSALLPQEKDGGGEEESWNEFTGKIAHRWLELVVRETGLVCTVEILGSRAQQSGPEHFGQGLFCTLDSANLKVPVAVSVAGDLARVPERQGKAEARSGRDASDAGQFPPPAEEQGTNLDLLLDIELQASLRFGGREMSLHEILELGPGDVVSLDRTVQAPVDLIVGDRIVARGEVVLVDGNYGLRVTAVAEPRKRLETVRCLF